MGFCIYTYSFTITPVSWQQISLALNTQNSAIKDYHLRNTQFSQHLQSLIHAFTKI